MTFQASTSCSCSNLWSTRVTFLWYMWGLCSQPFDCELAIVCYVHV